MLRLWIAIPIIVAGFVVGPVAAAPAADSAFQTVWERTDRPVAELRASRTWMWGLDVFAGPLFEPYVEATGTQRLVQYFDKSRMEINDPNADSSSPWYVTNGLLAKELMTGDRQLGDSLTEHFPPADVNVAGDANDPDGPTYATFNGLMGIGPLPIGAGLVQTVDRAGVVQTEDSLRDHDVIASHFVPETNHTIASVFWDFMNHSGVVFQNNQFIEDRLSQNPYYMTGYPLTESYWTRVRLGGVSTQVLVQVFERRVLTFTPSNSDGWKVEAGNVGQHYFMWRYAHTNLLPALSSPPTSTMSAATCLNATEHEVLTLINDYRAQNGVGTLSVSASLNVASYRHSLDMGVRNYFAHDTTSPLPFGQSGPLPWDRMSDAGYQYNTHKGENIAAGYTTAQAVFQGWKNSSGHNAAMLNPNYHTIGIGLAIVPGSMDSYYWTTDFGGVSDAGPTCP